MYDTRSEFIDRALVTGVPRFLVKMSSLQKSQRNILTSKLSLLSILLAVVSFLSVFDVNSSVLCSGFSHLDHFQRDHKLIWEQHNEAAAARDAKWIADQAARNAKLEAARAKDSRNTWIFFGVFAVVAAIGITLSCIFGDKSGGTHYEGTVSYPDETRESTTTSSYTPAAVPEYSTNSYSSKYDHRSWK